MADSETIYNWRRLDDRITTPGQPTEPQLADIHALGIRHVVNLAFDSHEKALPDEAASVGRLGMRYIHIPVDFQNPTNRDFDGEVERHFGACPLRRQLLGLGLLLPISSRCSRQR
jgi:protein tyrosine phosphatase (PTP) superfamily phosphohydrolase (DUF442 family)